MADLIWLGARAPLAVAQALRDLGVGLLRTREPDDPANSPVIVFTRSATRLPAAGRPAGRWIWLCEGPVGATRRLEAVKLGAYEVISLADRDAVDQLMTRVRELQVPIPAPPDSGTVVIFSAASRLVVEQTARVAPTSMSVLITGETGTGKEVIARLLHAWSPRAKKPFIPINCAAIPDELMEAELFGYARGAFSGAVQRYDGQLMAAEGGTVLLDEIDDTPLATQVKLLRVLEDRVVSRLGENVWHEVNFRLVAATNRDLRALIEQGLFGEDLYERLAIARIHLPPLRERHEDLPHLATHFMARFAGEQGRAPVTGIRADALRVLEAYPWPGNIRELRNTIYETLVYKRAGSEILLSDLPKRILTRGAETDGEMAADRATVARKIDRGTMSLRTEVAALERIAIEEALKRTSGNASQAVRLLGQVGRGVSRDPGGTLRSMMRRLKR